MKRTIAIILAIISVIAILPVTAFGGVTNASGNTVSSISLPTVVKGSETIPQYTVQYGKTDYISQLGSYAGVVIPITAAKSGMLFIDYSIQMLGSGTYAYAELYSDASLTTLVRTRYIETDKPDDTLEYDIPKSGNYWLVIYNSSSSYTEPFTNIITIKPYVISNQDRTLSSGKWSTAYYNEKGTYFKITLSKVSVVTVYSNSQNVTIMLKDSKKKDMQKYTTTLNKNNNYRASYSLAKGTYYIYTKGSYDVYKLKYATSAYQTLKAGKYTQFSQADGNLNMYVKFKATNSGYVTISGKNYSGYVTLCNSKQKAISTKDYLSSSSTTGSNKVIYGVTKGTTYYLRLNCNSTVTTSIMFKNTKITDQSGASKAKAKAISAKKTYKGYIAASNNTKDWYKFTLPSAKYWAIDFNGATNDVIKVAIYKSNGKLISTHSYYGGKNRLYTYGKYDRGTYYLCIYRGNAKSSGHYSINMKVSNKFLG